MKICRSVAGFVLLVTVVACATESPPIVIHQDPSQSIWLQVDPRAGDGHSHPAIISSDQMAAVLRGVRVRGRDIVGGFGLFAEAASVPAFLPSDIPQLASRLSEALRKASPMDMVTFYINRNELTRGNLVTSGGVFVRGDYLMLIVANAHTSPYSVQYENTSKIETRDQPLLPIARFKFTAEFVPPDVRVAMSTLPRELRYEGYWDNSKLLVLDVRRLQPRK